jgi:hypothetical protein
MPRFLAHSVAPSGLGDFFGSPLPRLTPGATRCRHFVAGGDTCYAPPTMPVDELEELRVVLREAVAACRLSFREIEHEFGLGHGSLKRLLDGEVDIRVHHLVEFARILQVHPMEFLELGFPDWPSRHRLTDWMRPGSRIRRNRQALPSTREELADLVRGIVQEELGAGDNRPKDRSRLHVVATADKDRKKP